jgi:hypothetical protein
MNRFVVFFFFFLTGTLAGAQTGKISGKVISSVSGQPLANSSVTLIETRQTQVADQNGNFSFSGLKPGQYTVKCSYAGHIEKIVEEIIVKEDDNTTVTISLEEKGKLDSIIVTSSRTRAARETVASLLVAQKNSASVSDGISAETIRRTPDRNTSDVLKRVSGASIQDDRFVIIRGLNDRYNAAFINGAPLPSTESDRKAFAFDIFPSIILDNIIIYKTATPDKPGEFAGGLIELTTKSTVPRNFTSVSAGIGYNSLITGKTRFYSAAKGSTDWLGIDDGKRKIPSAVPTAAEFKQLTPAQKADLAKLFGNYDWSILSQRTKPNFNFQLSQGLNFEKDKREFVSALFSVNYSRNFTFNEGERRTYEYDVTAPPDQEEKNIKRYQDSIYNYETVFAALGNLSLKLNNRNSFSWKNNFSVNADNKLIMRVGPPDFFTDPINAIRDRVRWLTTNKILSSQLAGEHLVGPIKTKLNWLGAYTKVDREIPNAARTSYYGNPPDYATIQSVPNQTAGGGNMFFAKSDEAINSFKLDITQPYQLFGSSQNFVKAGSGYQRRERQFDSRVLGFAPYRAGSIQFDNSLLLLPENQIFRSENLGLKADGKGGFMLQDGTLPESEYDATSALTHIYLMNDHRLFTKLRLIYGLRMERFNQTLTSIKDQRDTINLNTTVTDYLPSVNLVYALTSKMNLRASYSQTINRPEFRELAPFLFFDYATEYTYQGKDSIVRSKIANYDFRYEFFPGRAQVFSVSGFYKWITNPIEIIANPVFDNLANYQNSQWGRIYGVETEFRTLLSTLLGIRNENSLLDKITWSANGALIESKVKLNPFGLFDPALQRTERPLQGQSKYLINSSIAFDDERLGLSVTASGNRVGDRIFIAGNIFDGDIYEKARTVIDFQVAKFFFQKKLEIKLTTRDLLAQKSIFYFDFDKSESYTERDRTFSSYTMPKTFNLSVSYRLQ